jgi:hypothetical protein
MNWGEKRDETNSKFGLPRFCWLQYSLLHAVKFRSGLIFTLRFHCPLFLATAYLYQLKIAAAVSQRISTIPYLRQFRPGFLSRSSMLF